MDSGESEESAESEIESAESETESGESEESEGSPTVSAALEVAEGPVDDAVAPDDADDELESAPLPEPVESAKAIAGTDAIAAPTPKATASPATRPM